MACITNPQSCKIMPASAARGAYSRMRLASRALPHKKVSGSVATGAARSSVTVRGTTVPPAKSISAATTRSSRSSLAAGPVSRPSAQFASGTAVFVNSASAAQPIRNISRVSALSIEDSAIPSVTPDVRGFDFLVIGSGIAGLTYALKVAEHGKVAVITKDAANEGCTQYAQGGVCSVLDAADSVENHVRDTMIAGAFLNDRRAVEVVCSEGPARVLELVGLGAEFTRGKDGSLHLTREAGHSHRRIVHMADVTGQEIERALLAAVYGHPNIRVFENHLALDLVTDEYNGQRHCLGVDVLDTKEGQLVRFIGLVTMLASGGGGQIYPNTTNPHVATGDGIAMAYRAKAAVANMEFVQFHPTALYTGQPGGRTPLISEAVRGEGGILYNLNGERFMTFYDERLELAPRDIVARSIHHQMKSHGQAHVLLDISHKPADFVLSHFPNIAATCARYGVDITQDPIPVVPAQHYMCGGVQTGLMGETTVAGLYACGEVACSGLHGANRLASNSLLEGLVFAHRAVEPSVDHAEHMMRDCTEHLAAAAASGASRPVRKLSSAAAAWVRRQRSRLQALMWSSCGIVRTTDELSGALNEVAQMYLEVRELFNYWGFDAELVELRNLVTVAELVLSCALSRKESRGLHYVVDYPEAYEAEKHASVICTSLKARYDLGRVQAQLARQGSKFGQLGNSRTKRDTILRSIMQDGN